MTDDRKTGSLEWMPEPLRSHAIAVLAAGLNPARVNKNDVYLTEDAEHIEVSEYVTDPDVGSWPSPSLVRDENGEPIRRERVISITSGHPWWHDTSSSLPRVGVARTE